MTNIKDTIKDDEIRIIGNTGQLSRPQKQKWEKSEKEKDNNHLRRYLRHYLCNRGILFPSQRKRVSRRRVFRIVFRAE